MKVDTPEKICLNEILKDVSSVAVTGHIRPDGDCVGSCLGLWNTIHEWYPELPCDVYLEPIPERFRFLNGADRVIEEPADHPYDLVFCLDCNNASRLGRHRILAEQAGKTVCIDHHIYQGKFADIEYIEPEASSASELVCLLIGVENLSRKASEALYMGIAHDTGVFQYSCTSGRTMRIAGALMEKGIDYPVIVSSTYYEKTYYQKQILGKALLESVRLLDEKVVFSAITRKDMDLFCVDPADLDGIASELRTITGIETAIFLYETSPSIYKVSLRSSDLIDVNKVAVFFGGGGHARAAGCEMQGSIHDVVNNLTEQIAFQMDQS